MAQLLVRNLEAGVVRKLRLKAARDGISMEEEHRRILRGALAAKPSRPQSTPKLKMNFKDYLLNIPNPGEKRLFKRDRSKMRKIDL